MRVMMAAPASAGPPMRTVDELPVIEAAGAETLTPSTDALRVPALSEMRKRCVVVPIADTAGVVAVALMVRLAAVLVLRPALTKSGAAVPSCTPGAMLAMDAGTASETAAQNVGPTAAGRVAV